MVSRLPEMLMERKRGREFGREFGVAIDDYSRGPEVRGVGRCP
jgi:hypothetical protein